MIKTSNRTSLQLRPLYWIMYVGYCGIALACLFYPLAELHDKSLESITENLTNDLSAGTMALRITTMYAGIRMFFSLGFFNKVFLKKVNLHQYAFYGSIALILWYIRFIGYRTDIFSVLIDLALFFIIDDWRVLYGFRSKDEQTTIPANHRRLILVFNLILLVLASYILISQVMIVYALIVSLFLLMILAVRYTRDEARYI